MSFSSRILSNTSFIITLTCVFGAKKTLRPNTSRLKNSRTQFIVTHVSISRILDCVYQNINFLVQIAAQNVLACLRVHAKTNSE
jgi:hypothetical protein